MPPFRSKKKQTIALFLLVIAICITVMGSWGYVIAAGQIRDELQQAYRMSLLRTKERVDNYFRQMDQSINQLEKVPMVQELLRSSTDEPANSDLIGLQELLIRMQSSLDHVDNVMLYKPSVPRSFSTNFPMTEFHVGYSQVFTEFDKLQLNFAFMNMTSKTVPTAVYIRKLPLFSSTPTVYMLFHINQKFFDDMLGGDTGSVRGSYFVLGQNGKLLESRGAISEADLSKHAEPAVAAQPSGVFTTTGPGKLFITSLPPSFNGWTYGFAIPEDALLDKLNALRNTLFVLAALIGGASFITIIISANRLWRGWGNITKLLDEAEESGGGTSDEFERMYTKMKQITNKRDALEIEMRTLAPEIRDTFIRSLLDKGIRTEEDRIKCEKYRVDFAGGLYACLCVEIDQYKKLAEFYAELDLSMFRYGVNAVMSEVIAETGSGFSVESDAARMVGVLSLSTMSPEEAAERVMEAAEKISAFIGQHFPFTISIGVSRTNSDLAHLNVACREAAESLKHKLLAGSNQIIPVELTSAEMDLDQLPLSFSELENDLLYAIRTQNRELAYETADKLFSLQGLNTINYQTLQKRLANLVFSLYRQAAKGLDKIVEPSMGELLELSTLEEWVGWLKDRCMDPLIRETEMKHQAHMESVYRHLAEYINDHAEDDLRIENCCKLLSLPVTIAKQALKEAGGTTFAEYVLVARIERAKTWLRETDWSIDDIAEKLRYSNAQNFSRTFKKIMSVPPGHFRKEHRM